jgi:hypothetical protein
METKDHGALRGLIDASILDFPLACQKWMLGMNADGREVEQAVLKACQAWTNLANQGMERVFKAEGFAGLMTGSIEHWVRCQRLARDFIESMTPGTQSAKASGSSAEIADLRASVVRLRQEVRGLTARLNVAERRDVAGTESDTERGVVKAA